MKHFLAFCAAGALLLAADAPAADPRLGAGSAHSLGLHADGTVRAWGSDDNGMLGLRREMNYPDPRALAGFEGIAVAAIAIGYKHSLALSAEGVVYAWGDNFQGQLGDGSRTARTTPSRVAGLPAIAAVSAGFDHSLALAADGSVWAWGFNGAGHLGQPGAGRRETPVVVPGLPKAIAVSAGAGVSMAIAEDGALWTWGRADTAMLGDGSTTSRATPTRIAGLPPLQAVAAADTHALALTRDGAVWSWGTNGLANGHGEPRPMPTRLPDITGAAQVVAGANHSTAVMGDGTVLAWGGNESGVLGDGTTQDRAQPAAIDGLRDIVAVAGTFGHTLALAGDGSLWTWGSNIACEMAFCPQTQAEGRQTRPRRLEVGGNVRAVAAGTFVSLVVRRDGALLGWGLNGSGQLGNSVATFRTTPAVVPGLADTVAVHAGPRHSLALKRDGTVLAWGSNEHGQLGDDSPLPLEFPDTLPGIAVLRDITAISAGDRHGIALRSDGSVWAWGGNDEGQLGAGVASFRRANALPVPGLQRIVALDAGGGHNLALRDDGVVLAWGRNAEGQLGDGTLVQRTAPAEVQGLRDVAAVSAGVLSSMALSRDGSVWTWGYNEFGQLGDGTRTSRSLPARVAGLPRVASISAGHGFMAALDADGKVWTWGRNVVGELGDGSPDDRPTPRAVPELGEVEAITAGHTFLLALRRDGTLVAWGGNYVGPLGDGTVAHRRTPVIVLRENGAGTLAANDWFLRLKPVASSVAPERTPAFGVVTEGLKRGLKASIRFREADIGVAKNIYVFALAPAALVLGGPAAAALPAAKGAKDSPAAACVLAQLSASGQLVAASASDLQAFVAGVAGAREQTVDILAGTPNTQANGATFFVGYGSSAAAMLGNGTNRAVATLPGAVECQPQAPQTGWWWNPAEDGRGFSIEKRGNNLFFASFLYDVSGRSTWYVASGAVSMEGSLFTNRLYSARGGQTLGGAYAGRPALADEGAITLAFNTAATGTLVWPGGAVPIQRFDIVPGGRSLAPPGGQPESGWWWNEQESGRGFFLEWQGNTLDIAGYLYDEAGNPVWYLNVGEMGADGRSFSGSWWSYGNGQTLTGAWKPHARLSTDVAPLSIQFSGPATAIMTLPNGRTTTLTRHRF